jgi:hypothetical protein
VTQETQQSSQEGTIDFRCNARAGNRNPYIAPGRTGSVWTPYFADYLFLAFNTSTAFSPTDKAVLSRRAQLGMMVQSVGFPHDHRPACRASCEHSLSCTLAGLHDISGPGPRGRFVSPVAIHAAKSARTGSYESSAICRLNFLRNVSSPQPSWQH